MKKQKLLHVLAIPFPGQGHVIPMLHLVKKLANEGLKVTLVNVESIHEKFVLKQTEFPRNLHFESIPFSWNIPKGFDAYCMQNLVQFMENAEAEMTTSVEKLITDVTPDVCCILSDYFLPWTQRVADKYGVPRIALWCGSAAWASFEFHIKELVSKGHVPPPKDMNVSSTIIDYVPGLSPLQFNDIPTYLHLNNDRWIQMVVDRAPVIRKALWVLVDSVHDLEAKTFKAMQYELGKRFVSVGPLFQLESLDGMTSALRDEDNECLDWLDRQPTNSVVYISFGSNAVLSLQQFLTLASALESMKYPFLWVIRPELVDDANFTTIVEDLRGRTRAQGFITSWSPQVRVLSHSAVACFLTHCGWNSMLESIANGVAMLGWPWAAEQNFNCKLMSEDWNLGMRFTRSEDGFVEEEEIKRVMKTMMEEERGVELRARCKEMMRTVKDAMEYSIGSSIRNVSSFVEELKKL